MNRWHMMTAKMYLPAFGSLLAAFSTSCLLTSAAQSVFLAQLVKSLDWLPLGLFALSVLLGIVATVRLRRWELGYTLIFSCGGLLGREREGRFGPYRKCMACGVITPPAEREAPVPAYRRLIPLPTPKRGWVNYCFYRDSIARCHARPCTPSARVELRNVRNSLGSEVLGISGRPDDGHAKVGRELFVLHTGSKRDVHAYSD
jgi:hypothetical protein